jgi:hypothetical protein
MAHLLAGPYFGLEWKNVLDAQCQTRGLSEFLNATNWTVLQLRGAKHVHAKRLVEVRDWSPPGWHWHLLALILGLNDFECSDGDSHHPLVPSAKTKTRCQTTDFVMATRSWRLCYFVLCCYGHWVLGGGGGGGAGSDFVFGLQAAGNTAEGAPRVVSVV